MAAMWTSSRICIFALSLLTAVAFLLPPAFALQSEDTGESMMDDRAAFGSGNDGAFAPGDLLYRDGFDSRKESGWYTVSNIENYSLRYRDGKYQFSLFRTDYSAWSFSNMNREIKDFILEVDASQDGGPDDNDFGIVFRYADPGNYSLLLISGDGFYGYCRKESAEWIAPVKWIRSDAIVTGNSTNHLKAVAKDNMVKFYANDALLGTFTDDRPIPGKIGLWAEAFDESGVVVSFDNLKVWSIA
jgi:hypothetical protein